MVIINKLQDKSRHNTKQTLKRLTQNRNFLESKFIGGNEKKPTVGLKAKTTS